MQNINIHPTGAGILPSVRGHALGFMHTNYESLIPLRCADLCCFKGPMGDRREPTTSNPQSHPRDVTRRALLSLRLAVVRNVSGSSLTRRVNFWRDCGGDKSCQRAMRKTMERYRRLRDPRRKGYRRLEGTDHISEAGQVSVAIPAHMQNKEPRMYSAAAAVLTVLRNWISSSPSPPSAMAAQEPVQQPPLAPLHSRY